MPICEDWSKTKREIIYAKFAAIFYYFSKYFTDQLTVKYLIIKYFCHQWGT
jgi:hypothetical protein